ncbi:MAG: hypothetical protein LCH39_10740 [Proteobacteria bacterium]|nr:hypothetical protein [Pseudomonadota bacterium]
MAEHPTQTHPSPPQQGKVARMARFAAAGALIGLGLLSLVFPLAVGYSTALAVPYFLIAAGLIGIVAELIAAFRGGDRFDWLILLFSITYLLLGLLVANVYDATFAFSILIATGYLTQAVLAALAIFIAKGNRLWMSALCVCCALLAGLSLVQWPFGALQLAGISVGFSLISWGMALAKSQPVTP